MTVILEDTRQQAGKHEEKHLWWGRHGVGLIRSSLKFGDYCLPPRVAVDTKKDLYELSYDIDQDHERFRSQMVKARDAGVSLVVLVENGEGVTDLASLAAWSEPPGHLAVRKRAVRRIEGSRLAKACATMSERYGARFEFCAQGEAARRVVEILTEGGGR